MWINFISSLFVITYWNILFNSNSSDRIANLLWNSLRYRYMLSVTWNEVHKLSSPANTPHSHTHYIFQHVRTLSVFRMSCSTLLPPHFPSLWNLSQECIYFYQWQEQLLQLSQIELISQNMYSKYLRIFLFYYSNDREAVKLLLSWK